MPNPQTPLAKAKLTGADAKNPQRFRGRSEPKTSKEPVGNPPPYLDKEAKTVWKEFVADLGWLEREDRKALESAVVAVSQMRAMYREGAVTASMLAAVNTAIGKLGASPTDRGKVFQASDDDEPDDPFADFGKPN